MVGLIQVSFDNSVRLDELINKLDIALKKYRDLVEDAPEGASGEQLNEWRCDKKDRLTNFLDKEFNPEICNKYTTRGARFIGSKARKIITQHQCSLGIAFH